MSSKQGNLLIVIAVILGIVAILFGLWFSWFSRQPKSINGMTPAQTQVNTDTVSGDVVIMFAADTTYKHAKDLVAQLGYSLDGTNSYWIASNVKPTDDMRLKDAGVFTIKVPAGKEDEVVSLLIKSPLVRAASKNFVGHVN